MNIIQKFINFNHTKGTNKPAYIAIHETSNTNVGANAEMHYRYFNGGNRQASAHYFVDDKQIIQTVRDTDSAWHVGDNPGYPHRVANNRNSIGIEICVNRDGNYEIAVSKALELTKHLMKRHNIPIERVVTHQMASGKWCPANMLSNNGAGWNSFKSRLAEDSSSPIKSIPVLRQGDNGNSVKELQNKLIELGYWLGTWGADGDFGNATDVAVKKFQEDNNLTVDGIVGNQTWTKLDELIEEKNKPIEEPEPEPVESNIPEYKLEGVNYLLEKGFLDDEKWIDLLDEKADNWMVFLVLKRIHEDTKN